MRLQTIISNITLAILLSFSFSCQPAQAVVHESSYFSLKDYFENQIQLLEEQAYSLEKAITINGKKEAKNIETPKFQTELASFINNDINKPAWAGKYAVDSLIQEGRLKTIHYKAQDESLHTKEISIHFDTNGDVNNISLTAFSQSALSSSKKVMQYFALKNYIIESSETNKAGDAVEIQIAGTLTK